MSDYKRLTTKGCSWIYDNKFYDTESIIDLYNRLAELEDKIQDGTLIDINDIWYEDEEIKDKKRYIICQHYLTKMIVDFADNKAEAENKLKEYKNER